MIERMLEVSRVVGASSALIDWKRSGYLASVLRQQPRSCSGDL